MITEDYVSFDVAKLLKEKGFNEECFAAYNGNGKLYKFNEEINDNTPCWSDAPTLQMAMKWLREVHNAYVHIDCIGSENWKAEIQCYNGRDYPVETGAKMKFTGHLGYDTYEQACEAAIKYCLENLI